MFILLVVSLFLPKLAFSQELSYGMAHHILEHSKECVQSIEGKKIYILPEAIKTRDNAFTLEFADNTGIILPVLFRDDTGYFVECTHAFGWECDDCGRVYSNKPGKCKCGGTTFSRYLEDD